MGGYDPTSVVAGLIAGAIAIVIVIECVSRALSYLYEYCSYKCAPNFKEGYDHTIFTKNFSNTVALQWHKRSLLP